MSLKSNLFSFTACAVFLFCHGFSCFGCLDFLGIAFFWFIYHFILKFFFFSSCAMTDTFSFCSQNCFTLISLTCVLLSFPFYVYLDTDPSLSFYLRVCIYQLTRTELNLLCLPCLHLVLTMYLCVPVHRMWRFIKVKHILDFANFRADFFLLFNHARVMVVMSLSWQCPPGSAVYCDICT